MKSHKRYIRKVKEKATVRPFLSFFFLAFTLAFACESCFFLRFLASFAAMTAAAASSPLSLPSFSLLSSPSPSLLLLAAASSFSSSFPPLWWFFH